MSLELEGNILLERTPARRWVAIIAVVIPVAALVLASAWFIRAFVAPPTVAISSPLIFAAAPPVAPPEEASPVAVKQSRLPPRPVAAVAASPSPEPPAPVKATPEPVTGVSALPMFATIAIVPPSLASAPRAFADPAREAAPEPVPMAEPAVEPEASEPIAGPVPLPRAKPHGPVAILASAIPLPRPRPVEAAPPLDAPAAFERHGVE